MQELQHNDCKVTVFAKYIFDKGLIDYDNVIDLFYSWLFSRLHFLIIKYVMSGQTHQDVLDIGCRTGLKSFLYAQYCGSSIAGIDIWIKSCCYDLYLQMQ
jgi:ubiquinone/menaquinone biosynthesis C-methylase UbiE